MRECLKAYIPTESDIKGFEGISQMNRTVWIVGLLVAGLWPAAASVNAQTSEGIRLFEMHCATCHGNPKSAVAAPDVLSLWKMTPEAIYAALDKAPHTTLQGPTDKDKREIAFNLGGRRVDVTRLTDAKLMPNKCCPGCRSTVPPKGLHKSAQGQEHHPWAVTPIQTRFLP